MAKVVLAALLVAMSLFAREVTGPQASALHAALQNLDRKHVVIVVDPDNKEAFRFAMALGEALRMTLEIGVFPDNAFKTDSVEGLFVCGVDEDLVAKLKAALAVVLPLDAAGANIEHVKALCDTSNAERRPALVFVGAKP